MDEVDVLVVGTGPAGSTVAYELARRGHSVRVIEEHGRVGFPVQCAGLVSARVIELAGSDRRVRTRVHGATVYGPGGSRVQFKAPEPRAFVIDRAGLDIDLADRAARAGAAIETGVAYEGRGPSEGDREVALLRGSDGSHRRLTARLVIGADGVASAVARAYRLRRPIEILPAFEAEFPDSPGDPDQVEVDLGRQVAPGLFGWWIPDGSGGGRIGVAAEADGVPARRYFERLLDRREARTGRSARNPTAYLVSGIPIGTLPKCSDQRILLVGDAAAQVKPLSGGGIFTGMRCATIAAEVADRGLRANDLVGRLSSAPV
ncbi:geranylgeranyl reductase [mine drainage metagenome]|uniref:Geranylgeranyl reductase n=1 Tax=mine drainage metagenome TaxID=410659 RepID=T0YF30_9ZZZZ